MRTAASAQRRLVWIAGATLAAMFFVLNCSGLLFPILGPRADLESGLRSELSVAMPATVSVPRGTRVATNDPARYFEVTDAPVRLAAFTDAILNAARARQWTVQEESATQAWVHGPVPNWWTRPLAGDERGVQLINGNAGGGYILIWSPSTGRMWAFWFRV